MKRFNRPKSAEIPVVQKFLYFGRSVYNFLHNPTQPPFRHPVTDADGKIGMSTTLLHGDAQLQVLAEWEDQAIDDTACGGFRALELGQPGQALTSWGSWMTPGGGVSYMEVPKNG